MNNITPIGRNCTLNENNENGFRPLPVRVTQYAMGDSQITYEWVSAWQPTEAGLKTLNAGGHIELRILGATMPPVMLVETSATGVPTEAALHDSFVRVVSDVSVLYAHVNDILSNDTYDAFVCSLSESQFEDLMRIISVLAESHGALAQACSLFHSSIMKITSKKEPANDDKPTSH